MQQVHMPLLILPSQRYKSAKRSLSVRRVTGDKHHFGDLIATHEEVDILLTKGPMSVGKQHGACGEEQHLTASPTRNKRLMEYVQEVGTWQRHHIYPHGRAVACFQAGEAWAGICLLNLLRTCRASTTRGLLGRFGGLSRGARSSRTAHFQ